MTIPRSTTWTLSLLYFDRSVEKWVGRLGLFPVAERIGHRHRQESLLRVISVARRQLGLPQSRTVLGKGVPTITERVQHRSPRETGSSARIGRFADRQGYRRLFDWVAKMSPDALFSCTLAEGRWVGLSWSRPHTLGNFGHSCHP